MLQISAWLPLKSCFCVFHVKLTIMLHRYGASIRETVSKRMGAPYRCGRRRVSRETQGILCFSKNVCLTRCLWGHSGSNDRRWTREQGYSSGGNSVSRETSFRNGFIFVGAFVGVFFCVRRVYWHCASCICRQYCFTWNTALRRRMNCYFSYLCGKIVHLRRLATKSRLNWAVLRLNAGNLRLNRAFLPLRSRTKYCFHGWSLARGNT